MPIISDFDYCINLENTNFELIEKSEYQKIIHRTGGPGLGNHDEGMFENYLHGGVKYIYICVARCCSSTINFTLNHTACPEPKFHHMGLCDFSNYFPEINIDEYFKFAFVRNPWDRFVSLYHNFYYSSHISCKNRGRNGKNEVMHYSGREEKYKTLFWKSKTFEDFCIRCEREPWDGGQMIIDEPHFKPQFNFVSINNKIEMDFIGRYENINEDWQELCRHLNIEGCSLNAHILSSKRSKDYRQYYNKQTRECVERMYAKDIKSFRYEF